MAGEVPWFPRSLREHVPGPGELRAQWCYVVLEEIVDGVALLLRWPWPLADEKGRLFWPRGDDGELAEAALPVAALRAQLYRPQLQREPRVGDTFAVRRAEAPGWGAPEPIRDARELFPGDVLDVSAEARFAAKLAFQGSLVPVVPRHDVAADLVARAATERRQVRARRLSPSPSSGGRP